MLSSGEKPRSGIHNIESPQSQGNVEDHQEGLGWIPKEHSRMAKDEKPENEQEKRQEGKQSWQ